MPYKSAMLEFLAMPYYTGGMPKEEVNYMSVRNDIEKRIEKERQKITDLRSQVERSESFVQGLQEALKMLPRDGEKEARRASKAKTATTFRPGSDVEKAYGLLRQTARAMHISEILVGIGKEDTKRNRMSLASSLSRYERNKELFQRVGPNQFSLIGVAEDKGEETIELPTGFGIENTQNRI